MGSVAAPHASPLRAVVGTAGHVDHGKTALVRALTGIDTDRLPEEKRRGITLEAGYAHLALPGLGVAGVIDVPGHERFLRAMVSAAGGIDVALLCVAADEGPRPQTLEHLEVLTLLGARRGVLAITKADLLPALGEDHRQLLELELAELLAGTFLAEAEVVLCSARSGQGLPELTGALTRAVRAQLPLARPEGGPLFLPIDRSFSLRGFGTVSTGTLFSGSIAPEDEVEVMAPGAAAQACRVRGVQVHGAPLERALAGQRTAVNLASVELAQVPRGSALLSRGSSEGLSGRQMLDAELTLLASAGAPLRDRARLLVHLGTAQTGCVVALLDRAQLLPGETALVQLRLAEPVAAIAGLRFLLRAPGQGGGRRSTLAGGRVLSLGPRRRRRGRASDLAALAALAGADALSQTELLLLEAGAAGAGPQLLWARAALSPKAAERALTKLSQEGRAVLFDRDARLHVHPRLLRRLEEQALAAVRGHAQAHPLAPGIGRETLRQMLGVSPRLLAKLLAAPTESGALFADAEQVRPAGTAGPSGDPGAPELAALAALLDQAGLAPPRVDELPGRLRVPPGDVPALLRKLEATGRAHRVSEELWFGAAPLAALRAKLVSQLARGQSIDAQGFKELTGQTRKFTIPLAEYFDRIKVTLRVGDKRVLRKERER